jgi:hypothetical protein
MVISFSPTAADLGVIVDSRLDMTNHVSSVCRLCYFQLRQLRQVHGSLTTDALRMRSSAAAWTTATVFYPGQLASRSIPYSSHRVSTGCTCFQMSELRPLATFATSSTVSSTYLVHSGSGPPQPCSLKCLQLILLLLGTVRSMLLLPDCRTVYLPTLLPLKRFFSFAVDSSRISLLYLFLRVSHAYSLSSVFRTHRV